MERITKLGFALFLVLIGILPACADAPATPAPATSQYVTLAQCVKTFNVGYEKLFCLTEAAIASNNFKVEEIQSQGGYIVFSVAQYKFLATVFTFGTNKAILKITPCNNSYTFPPAIIRNIFKYIEVNQYKKF